MSLQNATLHQLRIFVALGEHLSMAKVAKTLHLTPSAVSIQIKQLSETVGQQLYEQIGKKLFLTEAGRQLHEGCVDIFARMEALENSLSEMQGPDKGSLKISVITTAKFFVPHMLGDFCKAHPGVEASLEVCNREGILDRLEKNQDDLYIMGQAPEYLKLESKPFMPNPLVLVAPEDHPRVKEKKIDPATLAEEPFLMRETGSGTRLAAENFFEAQGIKLNVRMVLGSDEAVIQAVKDKLGIALLSSHWLEQENSAGCPVALDVVGFPLMRQWHAIYPADKRLSQVAGSFLEFLQTKTPA